MVILTTAGYRFNWSNHFLTFKGTGSISIDIKPSNATAYLNGIRLRGSMPYRLNALLPDTDYNLRITASGYYDWQKNVRVNSNETYYLKDITMLKKTTPLLMATGTINYLSLSPNGRYLIFTLNNSAPAELWQIDTVTNKKTILTTELQTGDIDVSWHQGSLYATIKINTAPGQPYWYLLNADKQKVYPLNFFLNIEPNNTVWNSSADPELYNSNSTTLYVYRPSSDTERLVGTLPSPAWYVVDSRVWTLKYVTTTASWAIQKDTFGFEDILATLTAEDLESSGNAWQILKVHNNTVLLGRPNGPNFKIVTDKKIFTVPANQFLFSQFNSWWILWTPWEVWTYSENEEPKLLNRSGEQLTNLITLDQFNTLALAWKKNTTVLYPYYLISHDLLPGANAIGADQSSRQLYFGGKINKKEGLWQLSY